MRLGKIFETRLHITSTTKNPAQNFKTLAGGFLTSQEKKNNIMFMEIKIIEAPSMSERLAEYLHKLLKLQNICREPHQMAEDGVT